MCISQNKIKEKKMTPVTKRSEAKEGGFAQVRAALTGFIGDVIAVNPRGETTGFDSWGTGTYPDGSPKAAKEFFQIVCTNIEPKDFNEPLSMDISESWTFRVNCSDYKGSFWIDAFLKSADENKIQIPDGLIGKRVYFKQFTLEAFDKAGNPAPKFNATNFIIHQIIGEGTSEVAQTPATNTPAAVPTPAVASTEEALVVALNLAIGKTEQQFRSAASIHPSFVNSPVLGLIKTGVITQSLINDGKIKLVSDGTKQVYAAV